MFQNIFPPGQEEENPQPPRLFIRKEPTFKYMVMQRDLADEEPAAEEELNELGAKGWELIAVVPVKEKLLYYLKQAAN